MEKQTQPEENDETSHNCTYKGTLGESQIAFIREGTVGLNAKDNPSDATLSLCYL